MPLLVSLLFAAAAAVFVVAVVFVIATVAAANVFFCFCCWCYCCYWRCSFSYTPSTTFLQAFTFHNWLQLPVAMLFQVSICVFLSHAMLQEFHNWPSFQLMISTCSLCLWSRQLPTNRRTSRQVYQQQTRWLMKAIWRRCNVVLEWHRHLHLAAPPSVTCCCCRCAYLHFELHSLCAALVLQYWLRSHLFGIVWSILSHRSLVSTCATSYSRIAPQLRWFASLQNSAEFTLWWNIFQALLWAPQVVVVTSQRHRFLCALRLHHNPYCFTQCSSFCFRKSMK